MQNHKKIGDKAEIIAIEYMQKKGYELLTTNFKFGNIGEIDLVFKEEKSQKIIFVEVKYRSSSFFGTGEESINYFKKRKLLKTIYNYCFLNKISLENIRFDVISIVKGKSSYKLTHYKNQGLE